MGADVMAPTCASTVPVPYRIGGRRIETPDVVTIDLHPSGAPIADAEPGQFSMLYAFGVGEAPISVSGCHGEDGVLRHTIRAVGTVTRRLCALEPGAPLGVRGPFGVGWPLDAVAGHDLIVVGGGIGLAPLRPVVRRVMARRARFGRVTVVAGARTPDHLLYRAELDEWRAAGVDVDVTVDAGSGAWRGHVGVVTERLVGLSIEPARTVAMVCGPEVMMRVVARHLVEAGLDPAQIHVSLERNMHCAVGHCGHCQLGPLFVCTDGPVVPWSVSRPLMEVRGW